MQYPLQLRYKLMPPPNTDMQIEVCEAGGPVVFCVKQDCTALTEIEFFGDSPELNTEAIYRLRLVDPLLDFANFSVRYHMLDPIGRQLGTLRREEGSTLSRWKVGYDILDGRKPVFHVKPIRRLLERAYAVYATDSNAAPVMRLIRKSLRTSSIFEIERLTPKLNKNHERQIILSLMTLVILECFLGNVSLRIATGTAHHYRQQYKQSYG